MEIHSFQMIENAYIVSDNRIIKGAILIDKGIIVDIQTDINDILNSKKSCKNIYDAKDHWIIPGLIDIHCHGGNNSSFMDCTPEDFKNILSFYLHQGTTSIFPTSLSCNDELLVGFLTTYKNYFNTEENFIYKNMLRGVHLEGPFLSIKNAGAQAKEHCKSPNLYEIKKLLEQYPFIKRWTIAPEIDTNFELSKYLNSRQILVSAGHTDVLYDEMCVAFENGYQHMTHLYSGMNSMVYIDGLRKAGAVEAALLSKDITVEVIADGIHLPYPFIELVYSLKGSHGMAIITDAMRGTGTKEKNSILGNRKTGTPVILEHGVAKLPDHTSLAGSITTLIDMLRRLTRNTNIPFQDIVKMCTITPAKIMNIQQPVGLVKSGYIADFLELDQQLNIISVMKNGNFI